MSIDPKKLDAITEESRENLLKAGGAQRLVIRLSDVCKKAVEDDGIAVADVVGALEVLKFAILSSQEKITIDRVMRAATIEPAGYQ